MDYEAKLEAFYSRLTLEGASIIDVGAHKGRHAIPLARQSGLRGVVHAFEPIPSIRSQLVSNVEAAGLNNIVVYPFALSNVQRIAQFHYVSNLPEESGLKARHTYNAAPAEPQLIDVPTYRLDDLVSEVDVSFIKIDIEGGELDMLEGATKILRRARPIVAFECGAASFLGYHDRPQDLFTLFSEAGFFVFSILGEKIEDASAFREASFAQNFWDYLAIPVEKVDAARFLSQP